MPGLNTDEVDKHLTNAAKSMGLDVRLHHYSARHLILACIFNPQNRPGDKSSQSGRSQQPERTCPAGVKAQRDQDGVWFVTSIKQVHQPHIIEVDDSDAKTSSDEDDPTPMSLGSLRKRLEKAASARPRNSKKTRALGVIKRFPTHSATHPRPRPLSPSITLSRALHRPRPEPHSASGYLSRSVLPPKPETTIPTPPATPVYHRPAASRAGPSTPITPVRQPAAGPSSVRPRTQDREPASKARTTRTGEDWHSSTLQQLVNDAGATLVPDKYLPMLQSFALGPAVILESALLGVDDIERTIDEIMNIQFDLPNGDTQVGLLPGEKLQLRRLLERKRRGIFEGEGAPQR